MSRIFIDSFSGGLLELKRNDRTTINALSVLQKNPKVSTFEMTEKWKQGQEVWEFIGDLIQREFITAIKSPYPWHKYKVTKKGQDHE